MVGAYLFTASVSFSQKKRLRRMKLAAAPLFLLAAALSVSVVGALDPLVVLVDVPKDVKLEHW